MIKSSKSVLLGKYIYIFLLAAAFSMNSHGKMKADSFKSVRKELWYEGVFTAYQGVKAFRMAKIPSEVLQLRSEKNSEFPEELTRALSLYGYQDNND